MSLKRIAKWLIIVVLATAMLLSLALGYLYIRERPASIDNIAWMPPVGTERLLVVAPHCDDETLGCAALMRDAAAAGGQVKVVLVTNGDGFTFATREQYRRLFLTGEDFIQSGYARQRETLAALAELGIPSENVLFLGYPDRGVSALWETYWDTGIPYRSRYTGYDHSPYSTSYHLSAPYAGAMVINDLQQILADFRPTLIAVPHPADEHVDHAAVWAFIMAAIDRYSPAGKPPKVLTYLVHRGDYPIPHGYHPLAVLAPPLPVYQLTPDAWRRYPLNEEMVKNKETALRAYHSQTMVPIMSALLNSFIRTNELFAELVMPKVADLSPDVLPTDPDAWTDAAPLIENPPAVNLLGVFDVRRSQTKVFCRRQGETFWLRVVAPHYASRADQLKLSVVLLQHGEILKRESHVIEFTRHTHEVPDARLVQGHSEAYIGITPYSSSFSPDQIFVQLSVRDRLGILLERSGWFPAEIASVQQSSTYR